MRKSLLLIAVALATPLIASAPNADARPTRTCKSADLRYPFEPGGPKTFGVFKLTITGGTCPTAHRVAKAWMTEFEKTLRDPETTTVRLPRRVLGLRFIELPPKEPQTYRLRGRKSSTSIRFDYVVPNG